MRGFCGRSASEASISSLFSLLHTFFAFSFKKFQWAGGRNLNMFISKDLNTHLWAWHIPAPSCLPIAYCLKTCICESLQQFLWPLLRHFLLANILKFKYVNFNKSTFHQLQGKISVHTGSISWITYFLLP